MWNNYEFSTNKKENKKYHEILQKYVEKYIDGQKIYFELDDIVNDFIYLNMFVKRNQENKMFELQVNNKNSNKLLKQIGDKINYALKDINKHRDWIDCVIVTYKILEKMFANNRDIEDICYEFEEFWKIPCIFFDSVGGVDFLRKYGNNLNDYDGCILFRYKEMIEEKNVKED